MSGKWKRKKTGKTLYIDFLKPSVFTDSQTTTQSTTETFFGFNPISKHKHKMAVIF